MNDPSKESRLSFESHTSEERLVPNTGLKLQNKQPPAPSRQRMQQQFQQQVDQIQESEDSLKQMAIQLSQEFLKLLEDKTLPENRGPMEGSLKKEHLKKWENYILQHNNPAEWDLETPEGMGSLSGILIAFHSILKLKDRINYLEYKLAQLHQEKSDLQAQITELSSPPTQDR